jgi:PAS domain S-box-containing protein
VAASAIARDVTEQKRVEQAMRLRSELLEAAHEAIFAWSADSHIIYWNRGAEGQYGWTLAEALGRHAHDLLGTPPDQVDAFRAALDLSGRWEGELSHVTKGSQRIVVEARLALVDAEGGQYVVEASRDVTEQRRMQREAQEEMRLREQLLAVVAHDLRVPLTAIKGTADVLQRHIAAGRLDPNRLADQATRISQAAAAMASQIAEVLDAARLHAGEALTLERTRTDLVALTYRVVSQAQVAATEHRIRVDSALPELVGEWDAVRIERVLGNLLANAVKYSPDGGTITVQIDRESQGDREWARVAVRDQGVGIPAAALNRVFDRYYRAPNVVGRFPGEGIGLSGALPIVHQHGGSIDVQSQEGQGSTFTIRLPH